MSFDFGGFLSRKHVKLGDWMPQDVGLIVFADFY